MAKISVIQFKADPVYKFMFSRLQMLDIGKLFPAIFAVSSDRKALLPKTHRVKAIHRVYIPHWNFLLFSDS